jgi:single-strand DNA-binding protein
MGRCPALGSYSKDSGRWVDGPSLRVRVTCWRKLAEGVRRSVVTGDPLVVTGRRYTRDWIGADGQQRVSYELEAIAVGHDLVRGHSEFTRHRANVATIMVEVADSDVQIRGGLGEPVPASGDEDHDDLCADDLLDADAVMKDAADVFRARPRRRTQARGHRRQPVVGRARVPVSV